MQLLDESDKQLQDSLGEFEETIRSQLEDELWNLTIEELEGRKEREEAIKN